jgi:hypothetical protein
MSLMFDGTDVSIEDDSDVLQLQEGETVLVTSVKDEDDEDLPDLEDHVEEPAEVVVKS